MHPLTRFRKSSGRSARAIAEAAGTSRTSLHRIEKGLQTPSLGLVDRLCAVSGGVLRADDFLPSRRRAG